MTSTEVSESFHKMGSLLVCQQGHNLFIPFRCSPKSLNPCSDCVLSRSQTILGKLSSKMKVWDPLSLRQISMWTLGTNIKYNRWLVDDRNTDDNMKEIMKPWQKFNTRMKVYTRRKKIRFSWRPLFYVVEAGSQSNYLHIHLLAHGYMHHSIVRKQWSEVTQINNPNVNYLKKFDHFGYLAKYTSKSALTYRFLGELYHIRAPKYEKLCKKCKTNFTHLGETHIDDVSMNDE